MISTLQPVVRILKTDCPVTKLLQEYCSTTSNPDGTETDSCFRLIAAIKITPAQKLKSEFAFNFIFTRRIKLRDYTEKILVIFTSKNIPRKFSKNRKKLIIISICCLYKIKNHKNSETMQLEAKMK